MLSDLLTHVVEVFPPYRQGTILNNRRVIGIATNTPIVRNCALVIYLMMTTPDAVYHHTQDDKLHLTVCLVTMKTGRSCYICQWQIVSHGNLCKRFQVMLSCNTRQDLQSKKDCRSFLITSVLSPYV